MVGARSPAARRAPARGSLSAEHLEVRRGRAPLGAPLQQLGHHRRARGPGGGGSGSTSTPRKPTQSSAYAATPARHDARRRHPAVTTGAVADPAAHLGREPVEPGERAAAQRATPRELEHGVRVVGSPAPSRASGTARPPRSPASTAAIGPLVRRRRRTRRPRRSRPAHPGRTHREHRVGAPRGRPSAERRSSQSPSGSVSRSGHSASARSWASRGDTRCRVEGRGGTGLPDTMSAIGDRDRSGAGLRLRRRSRRRPTPVQIPSTSVIAGPPLGPVSPGSTRRTTTRWPTTCGPSPWAHVGAGVGARRGY